jgi:hypothetical protein
MWKRGVVVASLVVLGLLDTDAAAADPPLPFEPPDAAAAAAQYAAWKPKGFTLRTLGMNNLPRYLDVVPAGESYRDARMRLVSHLSGKHQHQGETLVDQLEPAQSARRIDLAFVLEGFELSVPDGMARVRRYGLVPLTLGQCTQLLIDHPTLVAAIRTGVVPRPQCAGTQRGPGGAGPAIAQAYINRDGTWVVGLLRSIGPDDIWPMSIFAGPR